MRPFKKHVKIIENLNNFLHIAFGLPILIFFHLKQDVLYLNYML